MTRRVSSTAASCRAVAPALSPPCSTCPHPAQPPGDPAVFATCTVRLLRRVGSQPHSVALERAPSLSHTHLRALRVFSWPAVCAERCATVCTAHGLCVGSPTEGHRGHFCPEHVCSSRNHVRWTMQSSHVSRHAERAAWERRVAHRLGGTSVLRCPGLSTRSRWPCCFRLCQERGERGFIHPAKALGAQPTNTALSEPAVPQPPRAPFGPPSRARDGCATLRSTPTSPWRLLHTELVCRQQLPSPQPAVPPAWRAPPSEQSLPRQGTARCPHTLGGRSLTGIPVHDLPGRLGKGLLP